ncbi:MAG: hypothetical protein HYY48_00905 [Gammaproteobacteria bacterium]|nr:hypothetical protein [Gammaproteobacteria bacterium]
MANQVRKVHYCKLMLPSRAGQGIRVLNALRDAGVSLLAFTGFPAGGGKAQVDLVAESLGAIRRVASRQGWKVSAAKRAFLIQGDDKVGAVAQVLGRLARVRINLTAVDAVAAGKRRYGMIVWVKPRDYASAAKALGAK